MRRSLSALATISLLIGASAAAGSAQAAAPLASAPYLFVTDGQGVSAVDRTNGTIAAQVSTGTAIDNPSIATGRDSATVYSVAKDGIAVVDTTTLDVLATLSKSNGPTDTYAAVALSPDGSRVYAPTSRTGALDVFDADTRQWVTTITLPENYAGSLAISPDGSTAYVTDLLTSDVTIIDLTANTVTTTLTVPGVEDTAGIAFSPDSSSAYILQFHQAAPHVRVASYDVGGSTLSRTYEFPTVGSGTQGIAMSPDGQHFYLLGNEVPSNDVYVSEVDVASGAVLRTVTRDMGDSFPWNPLLSADGATMYVAVGASNAVLVLDIATFTFTQWTVPTAGDFSFVDPTLPVVTAPSAVQVASGSPTSTTVRSTGFPTATLSASSPLPPGLTFTDNGDGTATIAGTAGAPGIYPFAVSAANASGTAPVIVTITIEAGPASVVQATSGDGQVAQIDTLFATPLVVTVRDAVGNPIPDQDVTFTVLPAGAATFAGLSSFTGKTGADGTLTTPRVLAGSTAGPVTVEATAGSLPSALFSLSMTTSPVAAPGAPRDVTAGPADAAAEIRFRPGAAGTSPTSGYRVTAVDLTNAARGGQVVEGSASPIVVTGLTNGDTYVFQVQALSAGGDSAVTTSAQVVIGGVGGAEPTPAGPTPTPTATPAPSGDGLAATGGDAPGVPVVVGMVLALSGGAGMLVASRRRARRSGTLLTEVSRRSAAADPRG